MMRVDDSSRAELHHHQSSIEADLEAGLREALRFCVESTLFRQSVRSAAVSGTDFPQLRKVQPSDCSSQQQALKPQQ